MPTTGKKKHGADTAAKELEEESTVTLSICETTNTGALNKSTAASQSHLLLSDGGRAEARQKWS